MEVSPKQLLSSSLLEAERERRRRTKIHTYYPETGPLRRELYPKHMAFFAGGGQHEPMPAHCPPGCTGKPHRERGMIAANRVGKTEGVGAYEMTLHLTGLYPDWWTGRRFDRAIKAWAAGDTSKTVRMILQAKLLGPVGEYGTGMIPGDLLQRTTPKSGVPDAVDTIYVRHVTGRSSVVELKSYDQRREGFQGTEQDVIWLDEECDQSIYTECLLRTMTNDGILLLTFTPLMGLSDVVLSYLPDGVSPAGGGATR